MKKPNIFNFATSELSQDAFICWLLEWAKPQYKDVNTNLNYVGTLFIDEFFKKAGISIPDRYIKIEIKKQYKNIDILCIINNEYAVIIEDKINTRNHSEQLNKYIELIKKEFSANKIIPIYFKTGDQDSYESILAKGYKTFLRNDFLILLDKGKRKNIQNNIYNDYADYLQGIEDRRNSYQVLEINNWYFDSWIGFYKYLKKEMNEGGWNYVSNPSGGFMGFWWHWIDLNECKIYCQLEQKKMCIKILVEDETKRSYLRNNLHKELIEVAKNMNINIIRPGRFGKGKFMTIGILKDDYRVTDGNNVINLKSTVAKIRRIQAIIDKVKSR